MFKTFQSTATKSNRQPKFSPGPQTGHAQVDGQPISAPPAVGSGAKQIISPSPLLPFSPSAAHPLAPRPSSLALHPAAFTLVELLIVIAILAILASMVLFALAGAEGTAKEMRTRSTINKLHNLIMQKYESYRTRRVPITVPPSTQRPVVLARHRLNVLRELMRMEMPERYMDIIEDPQNFTQPSGPSKISVPSATQSYRRALPSNILSNLANYTSFQNAECLYLIITRGIDDPDVMEQFSPSEIGDADDDGMKEFHDAWGQPINFLRWAPGFISSLHPKNDSPPYYTEHDPFDPRKVGLVTQPPSGGPELNPYVQDFFDSKVNPPLFPLIYSRGPDGVSDLHDNRTDSSELNYAQTPSTPSHAFIPNNPYVLVNGFLIGSFLDGDNDGDNSQDNITNHDLGTGPGQ